MTFFKLDTFSISYIHLAQKEIPDVVLFSDKIPAKLNHKFQLYDSLKYSNVYSYRFHDLTHSYFSSFGVLFANRDKRQDKSDDKIMTFYKLLSEHTLQFLNATLKNEKKAKIFIENSPLKNGFSEILISKRMKQTKIREFSYKDFNDIALNQDYQDLILLYERIIAKHPKLKLQEGMLNTLGLRLSFNPQTKEQGINVFLLALQLYSKSANLYDSLAEGYLYNKDFENAIFYYKKSLELNPKNQNTVNKFAYLLLYPYRNYFINF